MEKLENAALIRVCDVTVPCKSEPFTEMRHTQTSAAPKQSQYYVFDFRYPNNCRKSKKIIIMVAES